MKEIVLLSYLFGFSEIALLIFKRSKSSVVKTKSDRGSLLLLWILMITCIASGFFKAKYSDWTGINYLLAALGVVLYLAGIYIRWRSIIQLKQRFTVNVGINKIHTLETGGMYKHLRHPSYSGLLLILTGLSMAMNTLISFCIVVIPVFLGLIYRIYVEERLLTGEFGDEYKNFMATRKKIIPYIF